MADPLVPDDATSLAVHAFLPRSRANGPGVRAVLWVQGCTLGCPGCFNPETHARDGGRRVSVVELADRIAGLADEGSVEGLTVSGGEPLQQPEPMLALLETVRRRSDLSVLMFTGFTREEIRRMPRAERVLACLDVLVAGRYDHDRPLGAGLRGSANQSVHLLTDRYDLDDLESVPPAEVVISVDGTVAVSGIDPVSLT